MVEPKVEAKSLMDTLFYKTEKDEVYDGPYTLEEVTERITVLRAYWTDNLSKILEELAKSTSSLAMTMQSCNGYVMIKESGVKVRKEVVLSSDGDKYRLQFRRDYEDELDIWISYLPTVTLDLEEGDVELNEIKLYSETLEELEEIKKFDKLINKINLSFSNKRLTDQRGDWNTTDEDYEDN